MRTRLTAPIVLMVAFQLLIAMTGKGQSIDTDKVTLGLNNEGIEIAIKKIEQQSPYRFFYRQADISQINHLNLVSAKRTIRETLNVLLQNTDLCVRQIDRDILLERKGLHNITEIKGRVMDSLQNKPIANASVFLSNATVGTTAAADGSFTLTNIKPGKYDLVVSVVGYQPAQIPISAENTDELLGDINLVPKTITLQQVNVTATLEPDRERYYQWFKDEFLGTSSMASDCKIVNPEMLDLNYDTQTGLLTASSVDFLRIENRALGYTIKYLLTYFTRAPGEKSAFDVHYAGYVFFEAMPGTPAQQRRWQKKRLETYEGSSMHFLRSALNNSISEEGFRVLKIANKPNPDRPADYLVEFKIQQFEKLQPVDKKYRDSLKYWRSISRLPKFFTTLERNPLSQTDIVKLSTQKGIYALLSNNGALYISYNEQRRFNTGDKLDRQGAPVDKQSTILHFDIPYVLFDKQGNILNPDCISFIGAWGRSRLADLLPLDYDPAESGNNGPAKTIKGN